MIEYPLVAFSVQGREYAPGTIIVDEEHYTGELVHKKKSFRREQAISVLKFTYDAKTDLRPERETLQVAGLSFRTETEQAASELFQILRAPLRQAYEVSLAELKAPLRGFLLLRAEALGIVERLKSDPRSAVVQNRAVIPADAPDPAKSLIEALTGELNGQLEEVQGVLSRAPEAFRPRLSETTYALASALCAIQDARLEDNTEKAQQAMELILTITQLRVAQQREGTGKAGAATGERHDTDLAGMFLDGVLASLKDRMPEERAR